MSKRGPFTDRELYDGVKGRELSGRGSIKVPDYTSLMERKHDILSERSTSCGLELNDGVTFFFLLHGLVSD